MRKNGWSASDEAWLYTHYLTASTPLAQKVLKRSSTAISARAVKLGLNKKSYLAKLRMIDAQDRLSTLHRPRVGRFYQSSFELS
jgi:hypothetical protein